jgi:hypothetical protein
VHLDSVVNDPMPENADDPRVFDQDGDGNPGMTVLTQGMIDGEIYIAERDWVEMCGDVVNPNLMQGYIRWGAEQTVLGASTFMLNQKPESMADPDPERHRFITCRVDPSMTCQDIIDNYETLFTECSQPQP